MATPFTVYKLIVLYMLQNTENNLTNSQISEFILDREYTNYFHLQQAISELVEAELITMDTRSNVSHYRITEDGIKTLSFFQKDLSPEIKQEVRESFSVKTIFPGSFVLLSSCDAAYLIPHVYGLPTVVRSADLWGRRL